MTTASDSLAISRPAATDRRVERSAAGSRPTRRRRLGVPHWLAFLGMILMASGTHRIVRFTVSDWLFVAAVVILTLKLAIGDRRRVAPVSMRRSPPLILVGTVLMILGGSLSTLLSTDPMGSIEYVPRLAWLTLAWFWLLRATSPDDTALAHLIRGFKIAILIGATAALLSQLGVVELNQLAGRMGEPGGRQAGFYGHPNSFSGFLMTGLPFFVLDVPRSATTTRGRSFVRRFLLSGYILIAVGTTGSLSAMLAGVAGFAVIGVVAYVMRSRTHPVSPLQRLGVLVVVAVVGFALLSSDNAVTERLSRLQEGEAQVSNSVGSRAEQAEQVVEDFQSLLVVGTGFGSDAAEHEDFGASGGMHNMYLKAFYEGGLFTLLGLLFVLIEALRQTYLLLYYTRNTYRFAWVLACLASMVINVTRASFQPTLTNRFFWLPVALTTVIWAICRHEVRSAQQVDDPDALHPVAP